MVETLGKLIGDCTKSKDLVTYVLEEVHLLSSNIVNILFLSDWDVDENTVVSIRSKVGGGLIVFRVGRLVDKRTEKGLVSAKDVF